MGSTRGRTTGSEAPQPEVDNSAIVLRKMSEIYSRQLMADVILVVGAHEYPSHRLILCASSDVFQVMLTDPSWSEHAETRIELRETPSCEAVFEDFLRYLYTGQIKLDYATVIPVVSLADKYNVADLLKVGLDFMASNVATTCRHHQLVSCYQFVSAAGRAREAALCRAFILANFARVAATADFVHMELDYLLEFVQASDLVIEDEFRLFEWVMQWINAQGELLRQSGQAEAVEAHLHHLFQALVPHIRYPMMSPAELANLLLIPMSKPHTEVLVDEIRLAMSYHKDQLPAALTVDPAKFTPRLYTAEKYCASLCIDHYQSLQSYDGRSLLFSSQAHTAEHMGEEQSEWMVDIYPKGVWFQPCVTVYKPSGVEVPGRVLKTVRASFWTREDKEQRVKIGILLMGEQDGFVHVKKVITRNYIFSANDQIVNFDDILDFSELNTIPSRSPYLCGTNHNTLRIVYVITPLSHLSALD